MRYRSRISGPLLDRLDLQIEVPALPPRELHRPPDPAWSTASARDQVLLAVNRQYSRNPEGSPNGRLRDADLEAVVDANDDLRRTIEDVLRIHAMSGRARVRLLRVARTIADLADRDEVLQEDIHGAARLRAYTCDAP